MKPSTSDYERTDIPANLEEAYKALDELLSPEYIKSIKKLTEDDITSLHFGLEMWLLTDYHRYLDN